MSRKARWSASLSAAIASGGWLISSITCRRNFIPLGVIVSALTRRSPAKLSRRTRPRVSRRSAIPVTFEASQKRRSARALIGIGSSGLGRRGAGAWLELGAKPAGLGPGLLRRTLSRLQEDLLGPLAGLSLRLAP